jgi:hypothetical protein
LCRSCKQELAKKKKRQFSLLLSLAEHRSLEGRP